MKKGILSDINKADKLDFLKKLQSGKYKLCENPQEPEKGKTFDRIAPGLYKCRETGEQITTQQADELSKKYLFSIELISERNQQEPDGYVFVNMAYSESDYLNSLLIPKE